MNSAFTILLKVRFDSYVNPNPNPNPYPNPYANANPNLIMYLLTLRYIIRST